MSPKNTAKGKTHTSSNDSQPPKLFKYFSDDESVIRGIFLDGRIRFTQPAVLNDPLERNPVIRFREPKGRDASYVLDGISFPSFQDWISYKLTFRLDYHGILSLTKNAESFDMWSRYANGHMGFLIEFKADFNTHPCMRGKNGKVYPVKDVTYPPEYVCYIEDLVDKQGEIYPDKFDSLMFFSKNSRWADEEEWRMVRPLADHKWWHRETDFAQRDRQKYLFPFSLDCIQSITFGACMSPANKRKIVDACKGRKPNIAIYQAGIDKSQRDDHGHQGAVKREHIWRRHLDALCSQPDLPIIRNDLPAREAPVVIRGPSELPYYANNPKGVERFYKKAKG